MSKQYRKEIDGLRALAVMPVVLFHAGLNSFSGGFVGVDIFFVISGYLISRIILSEINDNTFTLSGFYERRIRRIIPALFTVIIFSFLAAYFLALPEHFQDIAQSSIAAVFSGSNFYFWSQSGYFSPASEFMPLLHTWSLGVEEQFYFIFPIVLFVLAKFRLQVSKVLLISLPLLVFISIWLSFNKPSFAFYLLPARAWELTLGAICATNVIPHVKSRAVRELLSSLGLLLILASIFLINSSLPFPGWAAFFPCIGAVLIISFATDNVSIQRILSLQPIVFIGLISYSLYLWHWPVLAFTRMYVANINLSELQSFVAVFLSFLLAVFTWKYIETPFRNRQRMSFERVFKTLIILLTIILAISTLIIVNKGIEWRLNPVAQKLFLASKDKDPISLKCLNFEKLGRNGECKFGADNKSVSYVIIGDSHAAAIRPAIDNTEQFGKHSGSLWWRGACPFLMGVRKIPDADYAKCSDFKEQVLSELNNSPEITHVILAGRWLPSFTGVAPEIGGAYRTYLTDESTLDLSAVETERTFIRSLQKTVDAIVAQGKSVVIVGSVPEPGFDVPRILALASFNGRSETAVIQRSKVEESQKKIDEVFRSISSKHAKVYYVPIWDVFCPNSCQLTIGGVPLYSDDDHITYEAASKILGPALERRLNELGIQ